MKKFGLVWVLALALCACGDDDGPGGDSGTEDTGTSDSGPGDDGGGDDGGSDDGSTDDGGGDDGATDDGGTDASMDTATDVPAGAACRNNAGCRDNQYCAGEALTCDGEGVCEDRPERCEDIFNPVCGCDGRNYGNPCEAAAARSRVASRGMCPVVECRLDPRGDGCCFTDDDCTPGRTVCRNTRECRVGAEGTCVSVPEDGECWVDSDCAFGGVCVGANQCECGALCVVEDSPGRCGDALSP